MTMSAQDHSHGHAHAHSHAPAHVSVGTMAWAVGVTLAFVVAEAICGYVGHSLALLSDAGHNLADAAALGLSWYALWIARRASHEGMTFGYHRVGVFAALTVESGRSRSIGSSCQAGRSQRSTLMSGRQGCRRRFSPTSFSAQSSRF